MEEGGGTLMVKVINKEEEWGKRKKILRKEGGRHRKNRSNKVEGEINKLII